MKPVFFTFLMANILTNPAIAQSQCDPPLLMIGYTEYSTNLSRAANIRSRRGYVIRVDGVQHLELAPSLTAEPNHWTEVVGWSPDGRQVIVQTGWQSDENAAWEAEHQQLRLDEGYVVDDCLVDIATGQTRNLTAIDRVCNYNSSLFFRPNDPTKLGFVAVMAPGQEKIYTMNLDGTGKKGASQEACGFSTSSDGTRIAYEKNYQLYLADADGRNEIQVKTGKPFNHLPLWSPDGQWVEFVAGDIHNSHPYIVRNDGTGLQKLGDRNGYEGWAPDFDTENYRQSSDDFPCWSQDSKWVYYTARVGEAVELLRVSLDGITEQLTDSPAGTLTYDPKASPDGQWIAFGSTRDGVRQLYVARTDGSDVRQLTHLKTGRAAKYFYWQPIETPSSPAVAVIPKPSHITIEEDQFVIKPETTIYVESNMQDIMNIGRYLSDRLSRSTGLAMTVQFNETAELPAGSFLLTTRDADPLLGEEGYQLTVTSQSVILRAAQPGGLFHGVQTIRQLLPSEIEYPVKRPGQTWLIPCLEIRDVPRFALRSVLLDSCRHFITKDYIKRFIDLLAYHKINRFHWHLTDDQCWAIEIKKYPKLTQIGSYRSSGKNRFGGYYTQDDIREIVAYAADRYITIVPEIEMPGHSQAALASYPELSCTGGPFPVSANLGIIKNVYCAGSERTFEFLEDVLTEVIDLFPSPCIHIGGDECPKDRWKTCPRCQGRIKQEGLKDEHELQSYFVKRIEKFLNAKGRTLIGWDEILEGGLPPRAVVQSWRGTKGGVAAALSGHDVIMSPYSHCYIDYPNHRTTLEKIYSYEPVPEQLTPEQARHILGAQANMWTDRCCQEMIDSFAYPRICALAELTWSPADLRDWNDFSSRIAIHKQRLKHLGVNYYEYVPLIELTEWEYGKITDQSQTLRFDITEKINELGGVNILYLIGWFTDGDHAVTIEQAALIADGQNCCTDGHAATIGWSDPLADYQLTLPENKPARLELEVTLRGEGGDNSRGKLWLSTVPNPPDIF